MAMALIDYSDSESESEVKPLEKTKDNETKAQASSSSTKAKSASKPAFHKIVDSANPQRIVIPHEASTVEQASDSNDLTARAAKRRKAGGDSAKGFNALLPAPKRANINGSNVGFRGLKTSADPGFIRDVNAQPQADINATATENVEQADIAPVQPASSDYKPALSKATVFKPLSVARKPKARGPANQSNGINAAKGKDHPDSRGDSGPPGSAQGQHTSKPPIPLFPMKSTSVSTPASNKVKTTKNEDYEPLLYQNPTTESNESNDSTTNDSTYPELHETPAQESLDDIAASLNLSASDRRQLFGRQGMKGKQGGIRITNVNIDEEYAANEALRLAGETVQHAPVRGISSGKHSLKQLVNVAANQKEALEESFAEGRRNKKAAGNRYGW